MYYKHHKVNFERDDTYIGSPDSIKKKRVTINPENTDDKCFRWVANVALNYEVIIWNPEIDSNFKPFINKYNW